MANSFKCFGARGITCQIQRIEEGFRELGLTESENPDFVYSNNTGTNEEAINFWKMKDKKPNLILNTLDIPQHLFPNYDLKKLDCQLIQADYVTCISETVKNQLEKFVDCQADAVIYQPAMPVFQTNKKSKFHNDKEYKYLIVGRNSDSNKRNNLVLAYLVQYDALEKLAALGSEPPYPANVNIVDWYGIQPIKSLNDFYNSVDYVFSLTKYGGIELSQIEAIMAGKFPIVAQDSEVALEFNPEFACEPTPEGIQKKILEIEENTCKYKEVVAQKQLDFAVKFDKIQVAKRILELV